MQYQRVSSIALLGMAGTLIFCATTVHAAPIDDADSSIQLPVSFDKVWLRAGKDSGLGQGKQSGLLTVSADGLEFAGKKQSHVLPWSRIEMVSLGRMGGDPDTKWVVLSLKDVAWRSGLIGFRDGQKLGYGGDTPKILATIVEGLQVSAAGPFAAPQGSSAFVAPMLQFALALPEGWHTFSVSETYVKGRPTWGRTILSPLDLGKNRDGQAQASPEMAAILAGSERAIFLDRFEADGFSCRQLGKAGRRHLREQINAASRPMRLTSELNWIEQSHGHCTAWSASGRAARGTAEYGVAFYAVSDDRTIYVFSHVTPLGTEIDGHFEAVAKSLRFGVAH
jgi:hypothetical protein